MKPAATEAHGQVVTPWDVQGSVAEDGKQLAIDYDKLIDQFGTKRVDAALLERFERLYQAFDVANAERERGESGGGAVNGHGNGNGKAR